MNLNSPFVTTMKFCAILNEKNKISKMAREG